VTLLQVAHGLPLPEHVNAGDNPEIGHAPKS
jgi:hypothetical protein